MLVVDDDVATQQAVAEVLEQLGAEVEVVDSAAAAMTAVADFHPQVLLCDIAMPGEDGYAFIRKLRSSGVDGARGTPALAFTALAERRRSPALTVGIFFVSPYQARRHQAPLGGRGGAGEHAPLRSRAGSAILTPRAAVTASARNGSRT